MYSEEKPKRNRRPKNRRPSPKRKDEKSYEEVEEQNYPEYAMDYAANIITPASMLYDFIPNSDLIEEEEEEFETIDLIYEEEEDQEHMDDYVDFKNYVYDNIEQINQLLEFGELDSELFSGSTKMPPTTTTISSTIEGEFLDLTSLDMRGQTSSLFQNRSHCFALNNSSQIISHR